jgi:fimbrial isopeptide formation D2 family protein/uncharacterized repeat protein (TIGR01451 family)
LIGRIRSKLRGQQGVALTMMLAFVFMALSLITGALVLAQQLSRQSRTMTGVLKNQYSALGANEHAQYRLLNEAGFTAGLEAGVTFCYDITLNEATSSACVTKAADAQSVVPPKGAQSRRLQTLKSVSATTTAANATTTLTYTITVDNQHADATTLNSIRDELPPTFTYVTDSGMFAEPGSTAASSEPSISDQQLTWSISLSGGKLQPSEVATLTFDVIVNVPEGAYCNEAYVLPGGKETGTGPSAKVIAGSPSTEECPGDAVTLTKTATPTVSVFGLGAEYVYTISVENSGTSTLNITKIEDRLPISLDPEAEPASDRGFYYVATGTATSTDVTLPAPSTQVLNVAQSGGKKRHKVTWNFGTDVTVPSGYTYVLAFTVANGSAVPPSDDYNEVWVSTREFPHDIYSWPTAPIKVMTVVITCSGNGQVSVQTEVWIGAEQLILNWLEIARNACPE